MVGSSRAWRFPLCFAAGLAVTALNCLSIRAGAIFVMKVDGSDMRKVVEVAGCKGHGSPQWSHDGKQLAFDASPSNTAATKWYLVNVDGSGLREMGDNAMPYWSPDDKQLVYQHYGAAGIKRGTWVQNVDGQGRNWIVEGFSPRWSPDGGHIAFTDWQYVHAIDLADDQDRLLHEDAYEHIEVGFDWSPDGKRLAFVGERNNRRDLVVADAEGAKARLARGGMEGHIAWSPDGRQICLTIDDRLWLIEVDSQKDPVQIPGQVDKNTDPAWSRDGKWLAFASNRKVPDSRPVASAKRKWKLEEVRRHPKGSIVYGLAFTPDGRRVVMGGDPIAEGVQVWDPATGETKDLGGHGIAIAMFPNGKQFATSWLSRTIQIIDLETGDVLRELDHGTTVRALALSPDGNRLVSGGLDHKLHVWNTADGEKVCTFDKYDNWVTRAAFSADGKHVFSAGHDRKLRTWDVKTGQEVPRKMVHPETVWGLAVSPDGRFVLTGTGGSFVANPVNLFIDQGHDNAVRMWDATDGKLLREMKGHTDTVYTIDISPDGRLAASGSWDGTIRLWDLEGNQELSRIEGGQGYVTRVVFSPDGSQLIAGGGVIRQPVGIQTFPNEQIRVYKVVEVQAAEK
jgi:WD40 repeat protein